MVLKIKKKILKARVTSVHHVFFVFLRLYNIILVQGNLSTEYNQTQSIGSVIEASRAHAKIIRQSN